MKTIFGKKLWKHKTQFILKSVLFSVLLLSINIISIFAIQLSENIYQGGPFDTIVEDRYYASYNLSSAFFQDLYKSDSSEYLVVYNYTSVKKDKTLRYTIEYKGNPLKFGFYSDNFFSRSEESTVEKYDGVESNVFTSKNISESEIEILGVKAKIAGKADFTMSKSIMHKLKFLNVTEIEYVFLLCDEEPTKPHYIHSYTVVSKDCEAFKNASSEDKFLFKKGSDLKTNYDGTISLISSLFYFCFAIPYIAVLIFWSSLISLTDTSSRKEIEIYRSLGRNKKKAFFHFYFENVLLSIPAVLINGAVFIPFFLIKYPSMVLLPLISSVIGLAYYLIFCAFYAKIAVNKAYTTITL